LGGHPAGTAQSSVGRHSGRRVGSLWFWCHHARSHGGRRYQSDFHRCQTQCAEHRRQSGVSATNTPAHACDGGRKCKGELAWLNRVSLYWERLATSAALSCTNASRADWKYFHSCATFPKPRASFDTSV